MKHFNREEILLWEQTIDSEKIESLYPCIKNYKDPRKEKLKDFRHSDKYFSYGKESPYIKRKHRRDFRAKCKNLIRRGKYDWLPKQPVGTQGWETW